jgi:hypothetical protein
MMFRSLFYVAPVLALDQQYKELLQRASSELSSGTLRSLEENLATKGGCSKHIVSEMTDAQGHQLEQDVVVTEWREKFNFKRKVKNDVKIAGYCKDQLAGTSTPAWSDAMYKDTPCKTLEKAKKQCSKSLKATCNFVRSSLKKLYKKALKGSRKIRKQTGFSAARDKLKTKVKEFSCKDYKNVKVADLKASQFADLETKFTDIYGTPGATTFTADTILNLKNLVTTGVEAKEASKLKRDQAIEAAKNELKKCKELAENAEKAEITAADKKRDDARNANAASTKTKAEKEEEEKKIKQQHKTDKEAAEEKEDKAETKCETDHKNEKARAEKVFKDEQTH